MLRLDGAFILFSSFFSLTNNIKVKKNQIRIKLERIKSAWGLPLAAGAEEDDEEGEGETVVDGVGGEGQGLGQEHGGGACSHRDKDGTRTEPSGQPQGKTEGEQQRHGTQAEGKEAQVVDEGAPEEVGSPRGHEQNDHDGKAGLG